MKFSWDSNPIMGCGTAHGMCALLNDSPDSIYAISGRDDQESLTPLMSRFDLKRNLWFNED